MCSESGRVGMNGSLEGDGVSRLTPSCHGTLPSCCPSFTLSDSFPPFHMCHWIKMMGLLKALKISEMWGGQSGSWVMGTGYLHKCFRFPWIFLEAISSIVPSWLSPNSLKSCVCMCSRRIIELGFITTFMLLVQQHLHRSSPCNYKRTFDTGWLQVVISLYGLGDILNPLELASTLSNILLP